MPGSARTRDAVVILGVPGDKSLSQRALILASLAEGRSRVRGLLDGADPRSTAAALRALGVDVPTLDARAELVVDGRGLRGLTAPSAPLDFGNSGTGARLMLGVLAAHPFSSVVVGDASLNARPMGRVTEPLGMMGARFEALGEPERLPLRVTGAELAPLDYPSPVASAQVKSSLLLAGLVSGAFVTVSEPGRSRDHTERMLTALGAPVVSHDREGRWTVELRDPPRRIAPLDLVIPGDFSSAAFWIALGLLGPEGTSLTVQGVGLNPTRTGFLPLVARMGGRVEIEERGSRAGEPAGDVTVRASGLRGIEVEADEVLPAIDEMPLLAALAAKAEGRTRVVGAGELRVKETDRIEAMVEGLRAVGVRAEELADGFEVEGSDRPLSGTVEARMDHRVAMAFGVLGAAAGDVRVEGGAIADVSFPGFWDTLGRVRDAWAARAQAAPRPDAWRPTVTIDGPAGSGKSSTAREVARRLGLLHLDSGALYRALTHALLEDGVPAEAWPDLGADDLDAYDIAVGDERSDFTVTLDGRVLGDAELRGPEVTSRVAELSELPAVRTWLLDLQRSLAGRGLVADGRDMGTVVFPGADLKVFLVADLAERARRRLAERGVTDPDEEEVTREAARIEARDRRDSTRRHSPLTPAADARRLDTSELEFEEQVEIVVSWALELRPDIAS